MFFGLYEHFVVGAAICLLITRNTRFFHFILLVIVIIQLSGIDYIRVQQKSEPEWEKYSLKLLGRIVELCLSVKKEFECEKKEK